MHNASSLFLCRNKWHHKYEKRKTTLIEKGAWETLFGWFILDNLMNSLKLSHLEKSPLNAKISQVGKRGGRSNVRLLQKILATINALKDEPTNCTARENVLEGNHPFMLGLPTSKKVQATLDLWKNVKILAINGNQQKRVLFPMVTIYT